MILLIGPSGGVDFAATSLYFRVNIDRLSPYLINSTVHGDFDFGIGSERAFRCCSCYRYTPLITGTADHIVPRTRFQVGVKRNTGELYNSVSYQGESVTVYMRGVIQVISKNGVDMCHVGYKLEQKSGSDLYNIVLNGCETQPILLNLALLNDIQNLQLMCCHCNSFKGNRT